MKTDSKVGTYQQDEGGVPRVEWDEITRARDLADCLLQVESESRSRKTVLLQRNSASLPFRPENTVVEASEEQSEDHRSLINDERQTS